MKPGSVKIVERLKLISQEELAHALGVSLLPWYLSFFYNGMQEQRFLQLPGPAGYMRMCC
jgi:hypothetical protein